MPSHACDHMPVEPVTPPQSQTSHQKGTTPYGKMDANGQVWPVPPTEPSSSTDRSSSTSSASSSSSHGSSKVNPAHQGNPEESSEPGRAGAPAISYATKAAGSNLQSSSSGESAKKDGLTGVQQPEKTFETTERLSQPISTQISQPRERRQSSRRGRGARSRDSSSKSHPSGRGRRQHISAENKCGSQHRLDLHNKSGQVCANPSGEPRWQGDTNGWRAPEHCNFPACPPPMRNRSSSGASQGREDFPGLTKLDFPPLARPRQNMGLVANHVRSHSASSGSSCIGNVDHPETSLPHRSRRDQFLKVQHSRNAAHAGDSVQPGMQSRQSQATSPRRPHPQVTNNQGNGRHPHQFVHQYPRNRSNKCSRQFGDGCRPEFFQNVPPPNFTFSHRNGFNGDVYQLGARDMNMNRNMRNRAQSAREIPTNDYACYRPSNRGAHVGHPRSFSNGHFNMTCRQGISNGFLTSASHDNHTVFFRNDIHQRHQEGMIPQEHISNPNQINSVRISGREERNGYFVMSRPRSSSTLFVNEHAVHAGVADNLSGIHYNSIKPAQNEHIPRRQTENTALLQPRRTTQEQKQSASLCPDHQSDSTPNTTSMQLEIEEELERARNLDIPFKSNKKVSLDPSARCFTPAKSCPPELIQVNGKSHIMTVDRGLASFQPVDDTKLLSPGGQTKQNTHTLDPIVVNVAPEPVVDCSDEDKSPCEYSKAQCDSCPLHVSSDVSQLHPSVNTSSSVGIVSSQVMPHAAPPVMQAQPAVSAPPVIVTSFNPMLGSTYINGMPNTAMVNTDGSLVVGAHNTAPQNGYVQTPGITFAGSEMQNSHVVLPPSTGQVIVAHGAAEPYSPANFAATQMNTIQPNLMMPITPPGMPLVFQPGSLVPIDQSTPQVALPSMYARLVPQQGNNSSVTLCQTVRDPQLCQEALASPYSVNGVVPHSINPYHWNSIPQANEPNFHTAHDPHRQPAPPVMNLQNVFTVQADQVPRLDPQPITLDNLGTTTAAKNPVSLLDRVEGALEEVSESLRGNRRRREDEESWKGIIWKILNLPPGFYETKQGETRETKKLKKLARVITSLSNEVQKGASYQMSQADVVNEVFKFSCHTITTDLDNLLHPKENQIITDSAVKELGPVASVAEGPASDHASESNDALSLSKIRLVKAMREFARITLDDEGISSSSENSSAGSTRKTSVSYTQCTHETESKSTDQLPSANVVFQRDVPVIEDTSDHFAAPQPSTSPVSFCGEQQASAGDVTDIVPIHSAHNLDGGIRHERRDSLGNVNVCSRISYFENSSKESESSKTVSQNHN